jgi:tRNA pseudouridine13 synthase
VPQVSAVLRHCLEDFQVEEQLGFVPAGSGEHVFLHLQKRRLNTQELVRRVAELAGIPVRDIGCSGLKDRNATTSQWLSVRMAGREEPEWKRLEAAGDVSVLSFSRHQRKLKRGVHRANLFKIRLRRLAGDRTELVRRMNRVVAAGVPNYFGEQRFGNQGSTMAQARAWVDGGGRRISRERRSLYLSALRAWLFNTLLADRVLSGDWNRIGRGDVCMLQGSRSLFSCPEVSADIVSRAASGDIHPGLPLWGRGRSLAGMEQQQRQQAVLAADPGCGFLVAFGLELGYRAARVMVDDFCWQFCDDDSLQLNFSLPAGSYATAVLAELVQYEQGD